jgi:hypothetical protein
MAGRQEGWEATFRPPVVSVERYSLIATSPEPGGALESPVRSPLGSPVSHTHMAQSNLRIRFLGAFHGLRRVAYHRPHSCASTYPLGVYSGDLIVVTSVGVPPVHVVVGSFVKGCWVGLGMLSRFAPWRCSAFLACSAQTHLQYQTIWCLG